MTDPSTEPDPLTVGCPDCAAPAGTDCRMSDTTDETVHADRFNAAALANKSGTCELCGLPVLPPLGCPAHGFAAVIPTGPLCPECSNGKPVNCAGLALDPVTDEFVPCSTVAAGQ